MLKLIQNQYIHLYIETKNLNILANAIHLKAFNTRANEWDERAEYEFCSASYAHLKFTISTVRGGSRRFCFSWFVFLVYSLGQRFEVGVFAGGVE